MAAGGLLGAARVARTLSKQVTPMAAPEATGANLVAATLVVLASRFALPVSTTHVTSGGLFGIGLLRRKEADWRRAGGRVLLAAEQVKSFVIRVSELVVRVRMQTGGSHGSQSRRA